MTLILQIDADKKLLSALISVISVISVLFFDQGSHFLPTPATSSPHANNAIHLHPFELALRKSEGSLGASSR